MIKIELDIVIRQPVDRVFSYLTNPENETQWQSDLIQAHFTSAGPAAVGATGRDVRRFMGRETVTTWQVTELEPNKKMAFKVISGPMPFDGAYLFESVDAGTRFVYRVQATTNGFSRLFDPLVTQLIRRQGAAQLTSLKKALEAQQPPM